VKAASPVLNGEVAETDRKALHRDLTQHHHSGHVLAYVFGRRQDTAFLQLQALLEPFGITRYYTDGWGAYERHIDTDKHRVGKENTQKIESKHINLRTRIKRLVRRTICFPKRSTCTIWSLGCSSIAMNLDEPYEIGSTPLRHLPGQQVFA
jgi:IS1 family transposase